MGEKLNLKNLKFRISYIRQIEPTLQQMDSNYEKSVSVWTVIWNEIKLHKYIIGNIRMPCIDLGKSKTFIFSLQGYRSNCYTLQSSSWNI